jgi:hypothetical protein
MLVKLLTFRVKEKILKVAKGQKTQSSMEQEKDDS